MQGIDAGSWPLLGIPHIQRRSHNIPLLARTTWQPEEVQDFIAIDITTKSDEGLNIGA